MLLTLALLASAEPSLLMARAAGRLSAAEPVVETPGARHRIAGGDPVAPTAKDRAVAADGGRCAIVGARLCTRKPRTLLSAELSR